MKTKNVITWGQITYALRIMGHMEGHSRKETGRIRRQLRDRMKLGRVNQIAYGRYQLAIQR